MVALFGGAEGGRVVLDSALFRPQKVFPYMEWPETAKIAAGYTAGMVRSHSFADVGRRTGFLSGTLFLESIGRRFIATEYDAVQPVFDFASSVLDEARCSSFLTSSTH